MSIVKTNINYNYEIMMSNIYELNKKYPFLQKQNAGYSVLGNQLPVIKLRKWFKKSFLLCKFPRK